MATGGNFQTTRWSLILAATDQQNPECREALSELCQNYWYPVYRFFLSRGLDGITARDVTQEFFTRLLEKKTLEVADPKRGRFRYFLLTCARNFLANWRDHEQALKRGGCIQLRGLDDLESSLPDPAASRSTHPDRLFEREWAVTLLKIVMKRLEQEQVEAGSLERFRLLRGYLTESTTGRRYREVATQLEMTPAAVKTAVYRLRHRFAILLRREVGQTISQPEEVESEIRFLMDALAS